RRFPSSAAGARREQPLPQSASGLSHLPPPRAIYHGCLMTCGCNRFVTDTRRADDDVNLGRHTNFETVSVTSSSEQFSSPLTPRVDDSVCDRIVTSMEARRSAPAVSLIDFACHTIEIRIGNCCRMRFDNGRALQYRTTASRPQRVGGA